MNPVSAVLLLSHRGTVLSSLHLELHPNENTVLYMRCLSFFCSVFPGTNLHTRGEPRSPSSSRHARSA